MEVVKNHDLKQFSHIGFTRFLRFANPEYSDNSGVQSCEAE